MYLATSVLGTYQVNKLLARRSHPLLRIGRDIFLRKDLARVECYNFTAAANLDYLLNKHLKVKDTRDLYERINPHELALPRMGWISLATLGAAFEAKHIGGASPLESWLRKHEVKIATWDTLKHREADEEARDKKRTTARRRAKQNAAHKSIVGEFLAGRTEGA